ncbi:MAG: PASTA domain-containing protein [Treponema sp.]|jgi:beta-lactam-binding protein with PASTA domain|nr:PASTA domain-containing protein [Treponema sp.]
MKDTEKIERERESGGETETQKKSGFNGGGINGGIVVFMSLGALVFAFLVGLAVFFAAVRGEEQIMTPDVRGKDIVDALLELQEKELYPRIQLRYPDAVVDRGIVLEQDPPAGAIVKAGRRIRLVISQGVMINRIEDYRGRSIETVRAEMQALLSSNLPSVSIKEPFLYEYSQEPAGVILEQHPEPGFSISSSTVLEFVVSRGSGPAPIKTPKFTGLSVKEALDLIGETNVNFVFKTRPVLENEKAETIVGQSPLPDIEIEADARITLTVASPEKIAEGEVFSLFTYTLAKTPYPLKTLLNVQLPSGERQVLLETAFSGGELVVPYKLPSGSVIVLSLLGRELHRETVLF